MYPTKTILHTVSVRFRQWNIVHEGKLRPGILRRTGTQQKQFPTSVSLQAQTFTTELGRLALHYSPLDTEAFVARSSFPDRSNIGYVRVNEQETLT